jgi:hypothetical protein
MVAQLDDRRVLKGGTNDYPARGFFLMDADRVDLKRFAMRLRPRRCFDRLVAMSH